MAETLVLDTSALLALRSDERGADRVAAILHLGLSGKARHYASFMTRMEILYRVTATEDEDVAQMALRLIDATGIHRVSCDPGILEVAVRFKARGGLSVADASIAAEGVRQRERPLANGNVRQAIRRSLTRALAGRRDVPLSPQLAARARASTPAARTGTDTVNVLPAPGTLSTWTVPPRAWVRRMTM